jgi:hypothetical protein
VRGRLSWCDKIRTEAGGLGAMGFALGQSVLDIGCGGAMGFAPKQSVSKAGCRGAMGFALH